MESAFLTPNGFDLRDISIPEPGDHEILVKTIGCGVCSGDIHTYRVRSERVTGEMMLGHEASGVIVSVGDSVEGFSDGDRVTAIGGAYADYFVAQPDELVKLPEGVDPLFALGEPLACCVHASERFGFTDGDRAVVIGCGFMGLICIQLLRLMGAEEVVAIDPVESRRAMALEMGATEVCHPGDALTADPDEGEYEVVVEAAGSSSALDLASDLVTHHGTITIVGYHESNHGQRSINMQRWNYKAIDVVNGHVRRHDEKMAAMRKAVELLEQESLITKPIASVYALSEVAQVFRDFDDSKENLFKAILVPANNG